MNFTAFTFTKVKAASKVVDSKLRNEAIEDVEDKTDYDYIKSVDKDEFKGRSKKRVKEELVIPCIINNNWRIENREDVDLKNDEPVKTDDLEGQAVREILESTFRPTEENNDEVSDIPLLLRNRIPAGYEEDNNMDVSLRPGQSTIEDYDKIPVEQYGMAMLRGMGWNKKEGIGLSNKGHVEMKEPQLRPKGLGLGAERPNTNKEVISQTSAKEKGEELIIKVGAFALITKGTSKGLYGKIEGFDEDNNRVYVKLCISNVTTPVSKFSINVVSEKEYKQKSKVLNNETYEKYKKLHDDKDAKWREEKEAKARRKGEKIHHHRKRNGSADTSVVAPAKKGKHDKTCKTEKVKSHQSSNDWLRTQLRVRFVDKDYKRGKFYEKKFIIEDVCARNICILRSDKGEIVEDVKLSQLETVIPRDPPNIVCILHGKFKGQVGQIVERDRHKYRAMVQILPDRTPILQLDFDDICEYVGDVTDL